MSLNNNNSNKVSGIILNSQRIVMSARSSLYEWWIGLGRRW